MSTLPEQLLALATDVAREAAALVADRRARHVEVADLKTSDIDVVTEADRASEELIRRRLAEARPDDGFLGEEGSDDEGTSGVRWVVDPIDGTVNFLYGIPQYAVSIAAELDGRAVAGVVLDAAKGTTYTAVEDEPGRGRAWKDGTPIRVHEPQPLARMLVSTGFSYVREVRHHQLAAMSVLLPQVRDLRRIGSAALDLCNVADGLVDAYVEEGVNPWDHAAGGLVARCAGARTELMTGAGGLTLMVCAGEEVFEQFRTAVLDAGFAAP